MTISFYLFDQVFLLVSSLLPGMIVDNYIAGHLFTRLYHLCSDMFALGDDASNAASAGLHGVSDRMVLYVIAFGELHEARANAVSLLILTSRTWGATDHCGH